MRKFIVFLVAMALIAGVFYSCEKKEKAAEAEVDVVELDVYQPDISIFDLAHQAFSLSVQIGEAMAEGNESVLEVLQDHQAELDAGWAELSENDRNLFEAEFNRLQEEYLASIGD